MISFEHFIVPLSMFYNEQITLLLLEFILVWSVIWFIFKKNKTHENLNLTTAEKENLINAYIPESLVGDINKTRSSAKARVVSGKVGLYIELDGIKCLNFSTHDYHGFIGNQNIEDEVTKCIETYGVSACGPRGFYGTTEEHLELEKSLAEFMGLEDSIAYSYGFAAIASAIPAYAKKKDIIFVDEKRNFAIQKGLDASKSFIKFFKHNDMKDLEKILKDVEPDLKCTRREQNSRWFLIVEGVYINTGEICPLPELVRLCKKYKLRILIDESISLGTLGETGRGVTEYFKVPREDVDLILGSLEYALGSTGGFCIGSQFLIEHQRLSGLGYCFSASLPPFLARAALEALRTIERDHYRLVGLNKLCQLLHTKLKCSSVIISNFVVTGDPDSPVKLLTLEKDIKDPEITLEHILKFCLYKNVAVTIAAFLPVDSAITSPSLRVTTNISHTEEHISYLILVLEEACSTILYKNL